MIQKDLKWYQKKKGILILLIFFFPVGIYQMFKNEIWTLQTRVLITLIIFFPYGLYVMWKEKNLWSKKVKIIISVLFGFLVLSGGGKGSFQNEYSLTSYDSLLGAKTRVDVIMKFEKLVRDPKYKGEYEYYQIHNGGSSGDLFYTGNYSYFKSSDGSETLILLPLYKNGRKMDYSGGDAVRDETMVLSIEEKDFSKLKFDFNGLEGEVLTKK